MQTVVTSPSVDRVDTEPLESLLANRRWWRRTWPFPHLVAHSVFSRDMYQSLEQAFQEFLAMPHVFDRNMPGYDASAAEFTRDTPAPLSIFVSRGWHDVIASVMNVACTGDVVGSLHHHEPGSASGRIHNDLNPGWFPDEPREDGIVVADHKRCPYRAGPAPKSGIAAHRSVRAVAVLFYMNNPPWRPGDGGETGLYQTLHDGVDRPTAAIPPINNSMICFECTPFSYHSFICNRRTPRNSVTMWLHRPYAEVVARWGEDCIVGW